MNYVGDEFRVDIRQSSGTFRRSRQQQIAGAGHGSHDARAPVGWVKNITTQLVKRLSSAIKRALESNTPESAGKQGTHHDNNRKNNAIGVTTKTKKNLSKMEMKKNLKKAWPTEPKIAERFRPRRRMNERSRLRDRNMTSTSLWPLLFFSGSLSLSCCCCVSFLFCCCFLLARPNEKGSPATLSCCCCFLFCYYLPAEGDGFYEKLKRVVAGKERGAMDIYLRLITL